MDFRSWFRSPRQLVALFLLVTVGPCALLLLFSWRLFQRDRETALRQLEARREQAASLSVAALQQVLAETISRLAAPLPEPEEAAGEFGADAVLVLLDGDRLDAIPSNRLAYWPTAVAAPEAPAETFAVGEAVEFGAGDSRRAAEWFRRLSVSAQTSVRAGALIRMARNLRKDGQHQAALDAYVQAARIPGVAVGGVPADLLARWARCDLLAGLNRSAELAPVAMDLQRDLLQGTWPIDRATYDAQLADTRRWAGVSPSQSAPAVRERLSAAVESLWHSRRRLIAERRRTGSSASGQGAESVTTVWRADDHRMVALVGGASYASQHWLGRASAILQPQGLRLRLVDAAARSHDEWSTLRPASDSGLPWTVSIEHVDRQGDLDRAAAPRTFWVAGLGVLLLLTALGAYVVLRAVTRELAVARLQSDFVAAVSHEFRTPLTTLRQLTEILLDSRVADDERRQTYYRALHRQASRLDRLVESLLDFGRLEAGTSPYRRDVLEMDRFIRDLVDDFQSEVASRGFSIDVAMDHASPSRIIGDHQALESAFRNLLDNAVKYSPDCRKVWVTVQTAGDTIRVAVRDRGFGIPEGEQPEIFRRFVRGARAREAGISGTGIGLAMVHHIVTAHGGRVSLESATGEGSTFTVALPLVADAGR